MRSTFLSGAMQVRASPSLLTGSTRLPGFHFDRTLLGDNPTCKRCRSSRDMLRSRLLFHPGPGEDPPRDLNTVDINVMAGIVSGSRSEARETANKLKPGPLFFFS